MSRLSALGAQCVLGCVVGIALATPAFAATFSLGLSNVPGGLMNREAHATSDEVLAVIANGSSAMDGEAFLCDHRGDAVVLLDTPAEGFADVAFAAAGSEEPTVEIMAATGAEQVWRWPTAMNVSEARREWNDIGFIIRDAVAAELGEGVADDMQAVRATTLGGRTRGDATEAVRQSAGNLAGNWFFFGYEQQGSAQAQSRGADKGVTDGDVAAAMRAAKPTKHEESNDPADIAKNLLEWYAQAQANGTLGMSDLATAFIANALGPAPISAATGEGGPRMAIANANNAGRGLDLRLIGSANAATVDVMPTLSGYTGTAVDRPDGKMPRTLNSSPASPLASWLASWLDPSWLRQPENVLYLGLGLLAISFLTRRRNA